MTAEIIRRPEVGDVIESTTGREVVVWVGRDGVVVHTLDRIARLWRRERDQKNGHWTRVGHFSPSVRYANVSNMACFGVHWVSESGTQWQLYNLKGTTSLFLGVNTVGVWSNTRVDSPERFGLEKAPATYRDFDKIVQAWFAAEHLEELG